MPLALPLGVGSGEGAIGRNYAEREGFEPSVPLPVHMISNHAPSTTRSSLRAPAGATRRFARHSTFVQAPARQSGRTLQLERRPLAPLAALGHSRALKRWGHGRASTASRRSGRTSSASVETPRVRFATREEESEIWACGDKLDEARAHFATVNPGFGLVVLDTSEHCARSIGNEHEAATS